MGPPPVVTGVSPKEGPPGTRVTIRGEFLGTSATDFCGLKICGCDCLLSAEWKSRNKIVARSGPCKGRGDIIVTTRSGGEGTSTVQFRGYHESIGPVKESAVWVEETAPPALPWGRRPMSPTAYTPPDPLGLSTEGDDYKFPEEELNELFPDGSGKLTDENFQPGWYLLEHHSNASFEDLKAGLVFLQRKVEGQKEGQLSFLKANTGAVMDQLDRLVLLKNMYEDDERKSGREPLPSLRAAIEESICLADSLFSEILSRKEKADETREALSMLARHKFLFQLPASIDRNIKRKEYDLVVNDYTRVNNLFGKTDVKLFQKILDEIDKKIDDLKENLYARMKAMPCHIQDQTKYVRLLISLQWEGDAAWEAVTRRHRYLMELLNRVREHFEAKEQRESGKRKEQGWSANSAAWAACASAALARELHALWPLARRYFAGELGGEPADPQRHADLKEMVIAAVQLYGEHMRGCLAGSGGGGLAPDALRSRLRANLGHLRDAYDALLRLDLPSQPLAIVERVIFEYRVHGMAVFLQRALKRVKALPDLETWKIEHYTASGAITALPHLLQTYVTEALTAIHESVLPAGRRESALLAEGGAPLAALQKHTQRILQAFVSALGGLALDHEEDLDNSSLSVLLEQSAIEGAEGGSRSWQRKLLVAHSNAQHTRRVVLDNIAAAFDDCGVARPAAALQGAREALAALEARIGEKYVEQKGDPLVGTIEPSMFAAPGGAGPADARPYVYEIVHNLIAVHAEVESVCGAACSRFVREMCETVCEEVARLAAAQPRPPARAAAFRARLDCALLALACRDHLTRKAENYLVESLAGLPPLDEEDKKRMDDLVEGFKKRMELQLACLNCDGP